MSPRHQKTDLDLRNRRLAWGLFVFAVLVATSMFAWRLNHNQSALPQGGSYGQSYHPVPSSQ